MVLTTSHRINYSLVQWTAFFHARGLAPAALTKVNAPPPGARAAEIAAWVAAHGPANYMVLDDDPSLHGLSPALKSRCVITNPLLGLNADAAQRALAILRSHATPTIL